MAPDAPVVEVDTEGAVTGDGPRGTADRQNSSTDTSGSGPAGHLKSYVLPTSPGVVGVDTEAANGGTRTVPPSPPVSLLNTLAPGTGGIPEANPAYRPPSGPVAGSTKDTTLTDKQPGGALTHPADSSNNMTGSPETGSIGAAGSGTGTTAPSAPTSPTAVTGPRGITVGWVAPADPSGDKVLDYVITCVEDGGTTFAPRGATSVFVNWMSEDRLYTFKVQARNKKGIGVPSTATSPAVRPYNPDVLTDPLNPGGFPRGGNPIYLPDGSIKPGTGGTPTVPRTVAAAAGAGASKTINVTWAAPLNGVVTSYVIKASSGETFTAISSATSKACVFAASGGAGKTFTVQALSAAGPGEVSAPTTPAVVSP